MEPSAPVYARGAYRVVAARGDEDPAAPAFLVVDTSGTRLHAGPSFELARAWVDDRAGALERPATPQRAGRR